MAHQATIVIDHLTANSPLLKAVFPLLVPVLLLFVLLRYFSTGTTTINNKQGKKLPPSPPALPLIGHLHLVGAHPHISMRGLAARHSGEDLMLLRLGAVPTLVASSPRAAQAVLRTHDQSLASRPRSIFGDILGYGPSDVGFAPYGDGWRQAKKLVTTHLLNTKKVQSYRTAREEEVGVVIDKIHRAATSGEAVDLSELLSSFTTDMVSRAVVGRSFRVDGLDKVFKEVMDASMAVLGGFSLENFYPGLAKVAGGVLMWSGRRKAERLRDRWDEVLDKVIDQHASLAAAGGPPAHHESDFIHVLLSVQVEYGLTRDGIKGILSDLFAAGTDTAYLVLEFTMAELMLHQDVMARLQAEVRSSMPKDQEVITEEYLTGMPYLKAVIKETLRLHPPSPLLLPHQSLEECTIDGYVVSAGTTVFVNAWAIGRDPRSWGDAAEEFMPERFINKGATKGVDFRGIDFQFLPFGSGRRMCPGMNFGLANVEIMLANLVCHFDWEMTAGANEIDMTEVFGLTVHRKDKLILTPRLPSCVAQPLEG
ncbi:unnamed protein product [Miscanthus lutarioriparius]|uniref:Uncharacterized protein n=1 Tax=Miscanthus lutarioriparius TaxID=422564 RepID=A0A811QSE0_9POAL|nr:unnamed protein product [Miscanthus lutarioriparius]